MTEQEMAELARTEIRQESERNKINAIKGGLRLVAVRVKAVADAQAALVDAQEKVAEIEAQPLDEFAD